MEAATMSQLLQHLRLTDWPFSVVPRPEHCTFVAGRPQLRDDVTSLLRALSRRDSSSIHVLWSWFGAGKTHSLYYMANRASEFCSQGESVRLEPIYTEFPKGARSFVDLYRCFVTQMDTELLTEAFLELSTSPQGSKFYQALMLRSPDLATTLRVLAIESNPQSKIIATRSLRGDPLPISEFRKIGVVQKLTSTEEATQTLAAIVQLLSEAARLQGRHGFRILWMLDEFQRIASAGKRHIVDINAGLHSLFNACPTSLTYVISVSGTPNENRLPNWFSAELRHRIGVTCPRR